MDRETALKAIRENVKNENLIKHMLAVEAKSIRKRFKEERFAAGANREQIAKCRDIGLGLDDFIALGLDAMKSVAADLGL
jgi:predicted hydrolase (HD superfamily)